MSSGGSASPLVETHCANDESDGECTARIPYGIGRGIDDFLGNDLARDDPGIVTGK